MLTYHARRLGIDCRLHDLRHSHASQLLQQGVHPEIVSERLGHATMGFTLDTYTHAVQGMDQEAAGQDRRRLADGACVG
jgi:integrase